MNEQSRVPSIHEAPDVSLGGDAHVAAYRETKGATGYIWNGVPILLLTTRGRRSGQHRTIPIIFAHHGRGWIIIGSKGGAPTHAQWYLNLLEDPEVQVQVKGEVYPAKARVVEGVERDALWRIAADQWPRYDLYQTRTDRVIPVVMIDPIGQASAA